MTDGLNIPDAISVPIDTDADGYLDRECPSEECELQFKILDEDWGRIDDDAEVYCPYCRHAAPTDQWWTKEQIEHVKRVALEQVTHAFGKYLDHTLGKMASDFNRRQQPGGFISMRMDYRGGSRPAPVMIPAAAADAMRSKHECGQCGCRYAVVGIAYFCPACGHRDAEAVFAAKLASIRRLPATLTTLRETMDRDEATVLANTLLEDGIKGGVTHFETIAKALYAQTGSPTAIRQNLFQNLEAASIEWAKATGKAFGDLIPVGDLERLNVFFQRRHILGHNDGHVDERYLQKSGDPAYRPEQRVVVKPESVLEFADLLEKLVNGMRECTGSPVKSDSE